jgi:hypothetical protein
MQVFTASATGRFVTDRPVWPHRKRKKANSSRHRRTHVVQSLLDTRTSYGLVCGLLLWVTVWHAHMLNLLHSATMWRTRELLRCKPHLHIHGDITYATDIKWEQSSYILLKELVLRN